MLVQVCVVIVTAALAAIAIMTIRAMKRFEAAADKISQTADTVQRSVAEIGNVTREAHEIVSSLSEVAPRVKGVIARFESLGDRTASLSSAVLEEVEAPVRTAVAISRAVRSGAFQIIHRLTSRFRSTEQNNGGFRHA
jgi:uncharacterized protein YoxC